MNGLFKSETFQKIPLYIIIAVIIFILIFVVVLASIGSNEKTTEKKAYYKKEKSSNKKEKFIGDNPSKGIALSSYPYSKISDSFVIDIESTNPNESYIFGGPMQYSTVSVYKKNNEDYDLIYTKVFSGNQGFVVCSNLNLVNPSYYQIGKKINLESLRYNFIPSYINDENLNLKIVVNNIGYGDFKVYNCNFNYDIPYKNIEKFPKNLSKLGLSEYDIEQECKKVIKNLGFPEENLSRDKLYRSFDKKSENIWKFNEVGDYIVFYVRGIYNFDIKDSYNNIDIEEKGNKDLKNGSLEYFKITDPRLEIINLDENIPNKSFNDDVISLMNAPVSFYKHFLYGKKKETVDIWNKIQNKIFVYKI
jgi:hypothetical protein